MKNGSQRFGGSFATGKLVDCYIAPLRRPVTEPFRILLAVRHTLRMFRT